MQCVTRQTAKRGKRDLTDGPSRKGEIGAPLSLREEQRQLTRSRLTQAAREVFAEKNFVIATVDDIAVRARVGRATFYIHFDSKNAVLMEVLREDIGRQNQLFRQLGEGGALDVDAVTNWIRRHSRSFEVRRSSVLLFNLAMGLDPEFIAIFDRYREDLFRLLGERIPAFRFDEADASPETARRRIEAHLLMFQLSQASFHMAFPGWDVDRTLVHRVVAEKFLDFIHRYSPSGG